MKQLPYSLILSPSAKHFEVLLFKIVLNVYNKGTINIFSILNLSVCDHGILAVYTRLLHLYLNTPY
jgi:hypothetical protein